MAGGSGEGGRCPQWGPSAGRSQAHRAEAKAAGELAKHEEAGQQAASAQERARRLWRQGLVPWKQTGRFNPSARDASGRGHGKGAVLV